MEDVAAKNCIDAMWIQHIARQNTVGLKNIPTVQTAVIGGFKEVLRFLQRSKAFVPTITKRMAALDADAESVCLPPLAKHGQATPDRTVPQQLYHDQKSHVVFLPWTPEVGLCEIIYKDPVANARRIGNDVGVSDLKIPLSLIAAHVGKADKELRSTCKTIIDTIAESIAVKKSCSQERVREDLFGYLVRVATENDQATMLSLAGKLFN